MIFSVRQLVTSLCVGVAVFASLPSNASDASVASAPTRSVPRSVDLPSGIALELLGEDLRVNGHRVSLWTLSTTQRAAEAVASIQAHWQGRTAEPIQVDTAAGWQIVSRKTPDGFEAVQLRDQRGRVEGYFAHWLALPPNPSPQSGIHSWLPGSVRIVSEVVSPQAGTRVTSWVGSSSESPAVLLVSIRQIAHAKGLQPATGPLPVPGVEVARFIGRSREWVVTLEPQASTTAVVAHLMELRQ